MDKIILTSLADLLINLSAGWFGAAIVVPIFTRKPKFKLWALIVNLSFGIVALTIAIFIRSHI